MVGAHRVCKPNHENLVTELRRAKKVYSIGTDLRKSIQLGNIVYYGGKNETAYYPDFVLYSSSLPKGLTIS